jgi:threonine dehydratase
MTGKDQLIRVEQIVAAKATISGSVTRTPSLRLPAMDEVCGATVALKAENLQRTGSFKIRGATAKLAALGDRAAGVATGSAGNHGQALAAAARSAGIPCALFVPADAPVSKIEDAEHHGAIIHRLDATIDECVQAAREHAEGEGLAFVHPFDDPEVIAGQGTIGLELLEEVEDLAKVIVPVGGGGLASGIAIAVRSGRPEVEISGIQVETCAPFAASLSGVDPGPQPGEAKTIADGIAIKRPGKITLPLLREWLSGVAVVSEDQVADAMGALMAEGKLVVEGAGAVGVAALMSGRVEPAPKGTTAVILSGGNVDPSMLEAIARRAHGRSGRAVVLSTRISDRPGSLAALLEQVAGAGANVIEVLHLPPRVGLHIAETGIELILETRGPEHTDAVVRLLTDSGYEVERPWAPV